MKNEKWFHLSIPEIEKKLQTNAATGLSRKAARSRAQKNVGTLFLLPKKSLWKIIGDLFFDFALILLLLAAVISLFFEELNRGMTVLLLILGHMCLVGIFHYRSQRTTESLSALFYPTVRVIRGGRLFCIDFRSVAVGDVMLLEAGDVICCDGRIVTSDELRVRMRLDRENYRSMEKFSDGYVNPKEYRASEMLNMVHAGSIVEKGSARVIVTATGRHTYLGAMTGGIEVSRPEEPSPILKQLQKQCVRINLAMLVAVIPLCIVSLLASAWGGGTLWLSASFLTMLSLVATTASQLTLIFIRVFYINRMRKLATSSAVIRSMNTAYRLTEADYLFVVDGSLLSDGLLHFNHAVCAEGVVKNYGDSNPTAKYLAEMVSLYYSAATRTVTTGVSGTREFLDGIQEFVKLSGVDEAALSIRCSCLSYGVGNMMNSSEQVCIADRDRRIWLNVSCSMEFLNDCNYVMISGQKKQLSAEGKERLLAMWRDAVASYQTPMIFSVCSDISLSDHCFVGMLLFKEGIDEDWKKNLSLLRNRGLKPILFSPTTSSAPALPKEILGQGFVSKEMFLKHNQPFSYRFGSIGVYYGFEKEDILQLLEEVRSKGVKVFVAGLSEEAAQIAQCADGFVSCSPMISYTSGYLDEELQTFEVAGRQSSASSTQAVKEKADVLVPRPSHTKGGFSAIIHALSEFKLASYNISDYLRYLFWIQILRIVLLILPMLFGQWVLDAKHVLLGSCVLDVFAFFSCLENQETSNRSAIPQYFSEKRSSKSIFFDFGMFVATVTALFSVFFLPMLFDVIGIAGKYLYPVEFSFVAMIVLHWAVLFTVRYEAVGRKWNALLLDIPLLLEMVFIIIFLLALFLWQPFGLLFRVEKNPLPYFVLSLIPSVLFIVVSRCISSKSKGTKKPLR